MVYRSYEIPQTKQLVVEKHGKGKSIKVNYQFPLNRFMTINKKETEQQTVILLQ